MPNAEHPTPPPHRIHLRGPWQAAWWDELGQSLGEPVRLRHPDNWLSFVAGRSGRVVLRRTFHSPTNLDPHESVFVILTGVHGHGEIALNNNPLGHFNESANACEFAVPLPLPFSNSLAIDVTFAAATPDVPDVGVFGVAALEIRQARHNASAKRR